ncbi:MAG: PEP-CTERM sorting domain-containing protein [Phycisphaeraceae bacterium]
MIRTSLRIFAASLLLCLAANVNAGTLHNNWTYALDSTSDGSGGSSYELLGIAYKQVGSQLFFAFSSNMPVTGNSESNARNGYISPGDLFLNFSTHNLDSAADFSDPAVFAVRFSAYNDSLGNKKSHGHFTNTTLGLYSDITPVSMSSSNEGYSTLQAYINAGHGENQKSMGDLQSTVNDVVPYLGNGAMLTNISAGTRDAGITLLNDSQLVTDGIDFTHFGSQYAGSEIYGFVLDASTLPAGNFTAHYLEECSNDGIAILGNIPGGSDVPEPATVALFTLGGLLIYKKRRPA